MESLRRFNAAVAGTARQRLLQCCHCARWADAMLQARPFADEKALYASAESIWRRLGREDFLEAFRHHPKIGDLDSLKARLRGSAAWAKGEQAAVGDASDEALAALAEGNRAYEERFGYIFIVCATGKSAEEMLSLLRARLKNDPARELEAAAAEQAKITRLRLEKLLRNY